LTAHEKNVSWKIGKCEFKQFTSTSMKALQSSLSFDFGSLSVRNIEIAAQKQHYYKYNTSERLNWFLIS
jgi:hypothetical protein